MTVPPKWKASLPGITCLLALAGCATAPPPSKPVKDNRKLEAPAVSDDFSSIKSLEASLEHSEEVFYEEDAALLPSVIDNVKTKGKDLYLVHRESMNSRHRLRLMKLFIKVADPTLMPAFRLCLSDARADELQKNPADLVKLLEAYQKGQLALLDEEVFESFRALRAHSGAGRHLVPAFFQAVTLNAKSEWAPRLIEMIEEPVVDPQSLPSKKEQEAVEDGYRDQVFWQLTAMEALGRLKEESAVPALFQVILAGKKGEFVPAARLALIRIGQPSSAQGIGLLAEKPTIEVTLETLQILAAIRSYGGATQVMETLKLELSDEQRFDLASLLPNFGVDPHTQAAFQAAFEALDCASKGDEASVCERLAPYSVYFFDASLVPWLLDQAKKKQNDARLSEANRASIARELSLAALRLGAASDNPRLLQVAKPNDLLGQAEDVLGLNQACRDDLSCYLGTVAQWKEERAASQILVHRSLVALATGGGTTERDALMALLSDLDDPATLTLALRAIDRLTPQSSEQVVSALGQTIAQMKADKGPEGLRAWTRELLASIETRPQVNGQEDGVASLPVADSTVPAETTP